MMRGFVRATNAPTRERDAVDDRVAVWCTRQPYDRAPLGIEIGPDPNRNEPLSESNQAGATVHNRPVRRPSLSPQDYRKVTAVALVLLVLIVVTGAAVRLTGSGLGCTDWPNCENGRLVAPLELNPMIEFLNRLLTGLVSVAVMVAVLGSLVREPRRRDLTWLSLGLVGGVIGQIVLGGLVVLFDLNPVLVQGHFVVSMVLVADAVVLHHRAGQADGPRRPSVTPLLRRLVIALVVLAGVVILTGTAVTGAGPHAGDEEAKRLSFTVHDAARVHGTAMILFLLATLATLWRIRSEHAPARVARAAEALLGLLVLQAAVGYTQYFTEIPPLLVGLHVLGATVVWIGVLNLLLQLSAPVERLRDWDHVVHAGGGAHRDPVPNR
jgi:heme a synthase